LAVAAACTNLDPRATRTRLRGALVAGAEPKEILETLELISVLAIHGYASVPGCSRNLTSDDRVRAYQLIAPGHAAVVDVSDPRPGPHEVLLKVRAAGVCGTDLKLLMNGVAGMPVTLGHEIVGEIVELGSAVRGRAAREMVAV
jgi:hypothetical protein